MANVQPGWPAPWRLSAPESYVLLNGTEETAEPFKLAIMELVSRGVLALDDFVFRGSADGADVGLNVQTGNKVLRSGPNATVPVEAPLASVVRIYQNIATMAFQGQVGVAEFLRQARRTYGSINAYTTVELLPALIERGLYGRKKGKRLWLFPVTRTVLTPAGQTARAELQQWVDLGQGSFGPWAGSDPRLAMAFLGGAGASVLLVPPVYTRLRGLYDEVDAPGDVNWDGSAIDFDPGSFTALDSSFDTLSSSVDTFTSDTGSRGGSDGGSGDGGSWSVSDSWSSSDSGSSSSSDSGCSSSDSGSSSSD